MYTHIHVQHEDLDEHAAFLQKRWNHQVFMLCVCVCVCVYACECVYVGVARAAALKDFRKGLSTMTLYIEYIRALHPKP